MGFGHQAEAERMVVDRASGLDGRREFIEKRLASLAARGLAHGEIEAGHCSCEGKTMLQGHSVGLLGENLHPGPVAPQRGTRDLEPGRLDQAIAVVEPRAMV